MFDRRPRMYGRVRKGGEMRKVLAVAIVALAAAAPASAKEMLGVQLCGASGCDTEKGTSVSSILHEGPGGPFTDNGAAVAPAKPAAWFRGYGLIGDRGRVHMRLPFYYVPGAGLIVQPGGNGAQATTWMKANGAWREVLDRVAAGLDPYSAPTITRATVNADPVDDPQSYLSLYSVGEKAKTYPREAASMQVILESKPRSPWTDGNSVVVYPKSHLLVRDGQMVSIPARIAGQAAGRASLAGGGRSFPWLPVAIAVALAVVVTGAVLVARLASWRRPEAGTA
jgi:hypothetical protein